MDLSFKNMWELNQIIDHELESTATWQSTRFMVDGVTEELEIAHRDPLELLKELVGMPAFCEKMLLAPEQHWTDDRCKERVYNEMNTGNWWWRKQVSFTLVRHLQSNTFDLIECST